MKTKVKIIVALIVVMMLTFGIVIGVSATESLLYESTGRIEIDQNNDGILEAVFDAQDIFDIDNEITIGKKNVATTINSYPDINIATFPTFDDIIAGIDKLTNFPSDTYFYDSTTGIDDASLLKRYKKVNDEYFECDSNGNILDETADVVEEEKLIEYISTQKENLSAGFAGYANKTLLLGDGTDNINYRNLGYNEGYSDGLNSIYSNVDIVYHYHSHEGDETDGGGCYTPIYHTHTGAPGNCYYSYVCGGTWEKAGQPGHEDWAKCPRCGAASGDRHDAGKKCTRVLYTLTCSKTVGVTIDGYRLNCGKTEETIESATIDFK